MVRYVVNNCSQRLKVKAILLQCYHHAIHNRYHQAKDLIVKTQVAKSISSHQIPNQIYYNRAIVQIGMAAFRLGLFTECNGVLNEVFSTQRLQDSLAQKSKNQFKQQIEKTIEEEMDENKRQVPPHLQVNLEALDCVYLTTSMFLEIPNIVENKFTIQKNVISRNFRKMIEQYDMKGIQLIPMQNRDFIVSAARHLSNSKWQEAFNSISQIQLFNNMTEFNKRGGLKEALLRAFKEVAFKIFLINGKNAYESVSLKNISEKF